MVNLIIVGVGGFFAYAGISALWVETQLSLVRRTALSLLVSAIALGFIIVEVIMIFNRQPDLPFSF